MIIGAALLLAPMVTTVLAATVSLNNDNRVEFGQGLYAVEACDSFVDLDGRPGSVQPDGFSYVNSVIIRGLNVTSCPETYIRIRIKHEDTPTTLLNLFQESDTPVNRILLQSNGSSDLSQALDLFNRNNQSPTDIGTTYSPCDLGSTYNPAVITCKKFANQSLIFVSSGNGNDLFAGDFLVHFDTPLARMADVGPFTIETSDTILPD